MIGKVIVLIIVMGFVFLTGVIIGMSTEESIRKQQKERWGKDDEKPDD